MNEKQDLKILLGFHKNDFVIIDLSKEDYLIGLMPYLDEKDKRLRTISKEVEFPLSKKDRDLIDVMIKYLHDSQIPELAEKYDLRPGMGMSAIQLGVAKRMFVVVNEIGEPGEGEFETYILINPRIISNSVEQIYVEEGEGCLSVNRPVEGIVPRYARVTMEAYDMEGRKIHVRGREDLAICFQHVLDHLTGILFIDHIDSKNPFKNKDQMRGI